MHLETPALWIAGKNGRMGQQIRELAQKSGQYRILSGHDADTNPEELLQGIKEADLILDFSTREGSSALQKLLRTHTDITDLSILVGSTGLNPSDLESWQSLSSEKSRKLRVLIAPNTSLGILVCKSITSTLAKLLHPQGYDIEIEETHHRHKKDAPSGTALLLSSAAQAALPELIIAPEPRTNERSRSEIGIHSTRGGGVFGEHRVRFLSENDEVTLSHRAFHRGLFAEGALLLGRWLCRQGSGSYTLDDVSLEDLKALG